MFICLSVLFICLSVLFICLSVCLFFLSVCLSVLFICLSVCSVYLSVCLFCLSVCSVYLSVCLLQDTSLSTPHLCSHVTQLLLAVGPSPSTPSANSFQRELGVVLLDAVAPQSLGELKQWPEEETLKYSLERYSVYWV